MNQFLLLLAITVSWLVVSSFAYVSTFSLPFSYCKTVKFFTEQLVKICGLTPTEESFGLLMSFVCQIVG